MMMTDDKSRFTDVGAPGRFEHLSNACDLVTMKTAPFARAVAKMRDMFKVSVMVGRYHG